MVQTLMGRWVERGWGVFESISVLSLRSQAKRVNVGEEVLRSEELKMKKINLDKKNYTRPINIQEIK